MKVILEPTVTVVGKSHFIEHPVYKIPVDGSDSTKLCAFAAKGCYDSFSAEGRSNVDNQLEILNHKHGSVMEHFYVSFFIEGVTRALTLELNRHRTLNISQRSTRYTKEEDSAIVLDPYYASLFKKYDIVNVESDVWTPREGSYYRLVEEERAEAELVVHHLDEAESAISEYSKQVDVLMVLNPNKLSGFNLRKWARGKARNLLPHALETRGTYTANLRAWRWIIEARSQKHAEPEIRRLADKLVIELKNIAPVHFDDFEISEVYDGIPVWTPKYSKV